MSKARDSHQRVDCRREEATLEYLIQTPPAVAGEERLPSILEQEAAFPVIESDLIVDLAIGWWLLVRVFFDKDRLQLVAGV